MGDAKKEVKLCGSCISSYCTMVHLALKLKGEVILNPVHKKVPVLVVDGRPIVESSIILEFVDEVWKEPPLLPEDPYLRAWVRFWVDFINQKLTPATYAIIQTEGEAQEEATKVLREQLTTLEEGIGRDFSSEGPFIGGERPGLLDVILGSRCINGRRILKDIAGVELVEKEMMPLLFSAMDAFVGLEVAKDTMMPYDKLLEHARAKREK